MQDDKKNGNSDNGNKTTLYDDLMIFEKGYQPNKGHLDDSKPPKGGSGVPKKVLVN